MELPLYQVDAFAGRIFEGNPAAVCPLDQWLDDSLMQAIAAENNLAETAFFVREGDGYRIRWFTPTKEVDLCGHATLAAAHVLFRHLGHPEPKVVFASRSGPLTVERSGERLIMDFPAQPPEPVPVPDGLPAALGVEPLAVLAHADYLVVVEDEETVRRLAPDLALLKQLDRRGVIVTAPGKAHDFVSRFFAPNYGIDEDPVTGSAHCILAPYWAERLGKKTMVARQVSDRGGTVHCQLKGDRVALGGTAATYLIGTLFEGVRVV